MLAVVAELNQYHQDLGAEDAGQDGNDTEVPELVGIEALLAANLNDEHEAEDQAQGGHQAVGRQAEIANVKETRKHLSILDAERPLFALRLSLSALQTPIRQLNLNSEVPLFVFP